MQLLKPMLSDPVPAIQQAAAVALGRYVVTGRLVVLTCYELAQFHCATIKAWQTTTKTWRLLWFKVISFRSSCSPLTSRT